MSKIMFLDVSKNAICILFVASTSGDRRQPCRQVVLRDQHPQYSRVTVASLERTASALRMVVHRLTRESRQEHEALRTVLEAIESARPDTGHVLSAIQDSSAPNTVDVPALRRLAAGLHAVVCGSGDAKL